MWHSVNVHNKLTRIGTQPLFFLTFITKNERAMPALQSGSRVLVEGRNTDEQLLFHLFDTLFKCFICPDLEIPRDKRPTFPAFLWLSRKIPREVLCQRSFFVDVCLALYSPSFSTIVWKMAEDVRGNCNEKVSHLIVRKLNIPVQTALLSFQYIIVRSVSRDQRQMQSSICYASHEVNLNYKMNHKMRERHVLKCKRDSELRSCIMHIYSHKCTYQLDAWYSRRKYIIKYVY